MWVPSEANDDVARFGLERDGTLYFERDGELIETTDGYEVLHYTGLDDSEGTPIYESDILDHGGAVATVEWAVDGWKWDGKNLWLASGEAGGMVIGNRYEHPELLESVAEVHE
jgi:hypothetical protein